MVLKIVCLNLWQGGNLLPGIINFLRQENADILGLQEVYNGTDPELADKYRSLEVIKSNLEYEYSDFAPAFLDNKPEGQIEQGNAVFSKLPIKGSNVTFFNEPYRTDYEETLENFPTCPRNLQHVVVMAEATEINFFNFQGVWDMDGDNYSPQRQRMSSIILKAIEGKTNVILMGDTNAKPTNQAIKNIKKELKTVFKDSVTTTFNMRRKDNPGYATAAVDMMFVSHNIQVLNRTIPPVDISDHLPLVVDLKVWSSAIELAINIDKIIATAHYKYK